MVISGFKRLVAHTVSRAGIPRMLHRTFFSDKLTIVTYHGIVREPLRLYDWCFLDAQSFRRQLLYLKDNFIILPLSEAIDAMRQDRIRRPTAAITFDDGYHNNYTVAFPILQEFRIPATVFLATRFVDTDDTFWNLRLNAAVASSPKSRLTWDGSTLDLNGIASRQRANVRIRKSIRDLPKAQLFQRAAEAVTALGSDPNSPLEPDSPFRILSSRAIAEMKASGLVDFGAHSHSHMILSRLSEAECRQEIELSLKHVQKLTGRPCEFFAYPLGGPGDYSEPAIRVLQQNSVRAAVTTIPGLNDKTTPVLELRRSGIGAGEDMTVFRFKVHRRTQFPFAIG